MKPVHIDGLLYVIMGFFGSLFAELSTDGAYKYLDPYTLFYAKTICGAIVAGATALKTYRSTGYADHRDAEDAKLPPVPQPPPITPPNP